MQLEKNENFAKLQQLPGQNFPPFDITTFIDSNTIQSHSPKA
jgi:hypothetical protein